MQLYYSPYSPYVRKVLVCAEELGVPIERLDSAAHPISRDQTIVRDNPLGQVPTLLAPDGSALYDSRVICEYLNDMVGGTLFPPASAGRWDRLVEQSVADGLCAAALSMRYEQVVRPPEARFEPWVEGQHQKIVSALDKFEHWAPTFGDRVDIGVISIACSLGYLDLRFPERPWRDRLLLAAWHERFSQRPSMRRTAHP
jgi:glutathione S-transferase